MTKFIEFRTKTTEKYERPYFITFNVNDIKTIKSQHGSQNVYLEVNGIQMEGSYDVLLQLLNCSNEAEEETILARYEVLAPFRVIRA